MKKSLPLILACAGLALASGLTSATHQPLPENAPSQDQIQRDLLSEVIGNRMRVYQAKIDQLGDLRAALERGGDLEEIREQVRRTDGLDALANAEGRDTARPGGWQSRRQHSEDAPTPQAEITPELREQALAFLRENRPEIADRLEALRAEKPEEFEKAVRRVVGIFMKQSGASPDDSRRMEQLIAVRVADREIRRLARAYETAATDAERSELTAQLREALRAGAEARLAFEARSIELERERLAEREAGLAQMREGLETSIEERLRAVQSGDSLPPQRDQRRPRGPRGQDRTPDRDQDRGGDRATGRGNR